MWALVEDSVITKLINNPKGLVIGDTRYSRNIFSFRWTNEERESIGIYEVIFDNSNKRNTEYYNNTNQSFNYADGVVTASYGTATPKELADILYTQEDSDNGDLPNDKEIGDVKVKGLKSRKKEIIKKQASELLEKTDWYNHKALDDETFTIPANIKTYRANVRTKSNEMETAIDNASDVSALENLYTYNDNNPPTRPLGEWPTLED
tara:strand:- start:12 stop:632 length:621 start_codon:yes stop_codon:yes gene_type:complete